MRISRYVEEENPTSKLSRCHVVPRGGQERENSLWRVRKTREQLLPPGDGGAMSILLSRREAPLWAEIDGAALKLKTMAVLNTRRTFLLLICLHQWELCLNVWCIMHALLTFACYFHCHKYKWINWNYKSVVIYTQFFFNVFQENCTLTFLV